MTSPSHALEYTEDLSQDIHDPNAIAIFLPSVGASYIGYASEFSHKASTCRHRGAHEIPNPDGKRAKYTGGHGPAGMHADGRELNFLRPDNGSFYWPYTLWSAGHANLDLGRDAQEIHRRENMIHQRNRSTSIVVGDSGGYQIGTGIIKFDWKNFHSADNDAMRLKILRWLEATADYSMTLDCPPWAIGNARCGLVDFNDCLSKTLYNNDFFVKNRRPGATKLLNVLQGRNRAECDQWWDAVKHYDFEGWATAGAQTKDFELLLARLIIMRDQGFITPQRSWFHALGVSKMAHSCIFTAIQRAMRRHVEPSFTISYDASSPFLCAAKGQMYTKNTYGSKNLSYTTDPVIDNKALHGSKLAFPLKSSIGRKLTLGDICCKHPSEPTKSSWDSISYMLMMNHNVYMHAKGVVEVNAFYDLPEPQIRNYIPRNLLEFKDLVQEIFTVQDPMSLIHENSRLLRGLSGHRTNASKINAFQTHGFFELEDDATNLMLDGLEDHEFNDAVIEDLED